MAKQNVYAGLPALSHFLKGALGRFGSQMEQRASEEEKVTARALAKTG